MHVKSTRENICCYDHINWSFSEFLDAVISFFFRQFTKHNEASAPALIKFIVYLFGKIFGVDENDCLSVIIERIEYLHDIVNLTAFFALIVKLLNVVKLDWLNLHGDLDCILDDFGDLSSHLFFVCGWEKDELDLVRQLFDFIYELI